MNNKSLIFLAIKSLDIQNQTSTIINTCNLNFNTQLNHLINFNIQSDKDLKNIIFKVLISFSKQNLDSNNLANNYKRRFRYYFKQRVFFQHIEQSVYNNNILIDKLGITSLYLLYLILDTKEAFKLWRYYKDYTFEKLIKILETKNNLLI